MGRATLPRGRAVLGALLVTCSVVGLLTAHRAATRPRLQQWLIATSTINAGQRIEAGDLGLTELDLGEVVAAGAFGDPEELIGRVALSPIREGEIIQRSTVGARPVETGPARRVTVALPRARALDGSIGAGDRVDVLGTPGEPGTTSVLAREALVVSVGGDPEGLGATDEIAVTLVVSDEAAATTIVDSSVHGTLTLVGPTRLDP